MSAEGSKPAMPQSTLNMFDPEFIASPQAGYDELRKTCPVARQPMGGAIITRYEDVIWALRHPEIFSSEMELQMALGTERPMIPQQIDPPAQTKYRKLLDPQFSRKRMALIEPAVRQHAGELIDAIVVKGECEFNRDFAIPLPCTAFLKLMGLPQAELDLFLELKDGIIRPHMQTQDFAKAGEIRKEAGQRIYAYFDDLIDGRRAAPSDDFFSFLVQAEIDGEKLTRNEILDICFLMLLAGLDTVTATLGCNIAYLAANPEQRWKLVANPDLIPGAIEELLRWETPVTAVPRVVKQDVTVGGVEIKKGEMAMLLLGASNLDEGEFNDPSLVDFERERNRHLAFGGGAHRCLGSHLARLEIEVALDEWHRRVPEYQIKPGEVPRYSPGIREVQYLPLVWDTSA